MQERLVTVFGGTGFLGRRVVRVLSEAGFRPRVAARRPDAVDFSDPERRPWLAAVDVRDADAVAEAIDGATAVVNAVSLYVEKDGLDFEAIHVDGARRIARRCRETGAAALVHVSGIGADAESPSKLVRAKARGEAAVTREFPSATIFRPSVMFGRDDAFVRNIVKATRSPVVPLFGRGDMRLQPAWVRDVARGVVQAIAQAGHGGRTFELGGSRVLTYRQALEAVCAALDRRRLLVPFPLAGWKMLVRAMSVLPSPPLTVDQLHLLAAGNVVSPGSETFARLGIEPRSLTDMLPHCLSSGPGEVSGP